MISSDLIQLVGIVTAVLCVAAVVKWWKSEYTPQHWLFFASRALGALGIVGFYYAIDHSVLDYAQLIIVSRWLWLLVLVNMALLAISVLAYRK